MTTEQQLKEGSLGMRVTYGYIRHPFSHPEWGEILCAFLGMLQFIYAVTMFDQLDTKEGYSLTVFFSPEGWSVAGLLLCIMHLGSLRLKDSSNGFKFRLVAVASSLAFWSHFILSVVINAALFEAPFPGTLVPSLGAPLLASAVLFRLWRRY
jgi:hypothetical protein